MQALIDFEGWRKWRKFDEQQNPEGPVPVTSSTTSLEPSGGRESEAVALQRRKSQSNITHLSGNVKVMTSSDNSSSSSNDNRNSNKGNEEASANRDGAAIATGSPTKQLSASGKESGSNSASSPVAAITAAAAGVPNRTSKPDATSPGERGTAGTYSAGFKRVNRNTNSRI